MPVRPETLKFAKSLAGRTAVPPSSNTGLKPIRVLGLSERAEAAAMRFMDEHFDLGHRAHGGVPPSFLWTTAWTMIGTAHITLLPFIHPRVVLRQLEPPCTYAEILLFSAKPAISVDEAEHRADLFCHRALERARQLYRDGYYADPFSGNPVVRGGIH